MGVNCLPLSYLVHLNPSLPNASQFEKLQCLYQMKIGTLGLGALICVIKSMLPFDFLFFKQYPPANQKTGGQQARLPS